MRRAMMALVVLLFASVAWADVDVAKFIDKIKDANPTRLIPAGRVEFTSYISGLDNGRPFAYVQQGVLSFNKDRILLEKHIIEGEPPLGDKFRAKLAIEEGHQLRIARDVFEAYTPTTQSVWSLTSSVMRVDDKYCPPIEMYDMATGGIPPRETLAAIVADENSSFSDGKVTVKRGSTRSYSLTTDENGRLVSYTNTNGPSQRTLTRRGDVVVGGYHVPEEMTIEYSQPSFQCVETAQLRYIPGHLTDADLEIHTPQGVRVADGTKRGREHRDWIAAHSSPAIYGCAYLCIEHLQGDHHWCCGEYCNDNSWVIYDHGHCQLCGDWYHFCDHSYIITGAYNPACFCPCYWGLCPEWGCLPMTGQWQWQEEWACTETTDC